MTVEEMVTLENLGHGAAVERFSDVLSRVLENIVDPNTSPTAVREVTMKVRIKPDKERTTAAVTYQVVGKLAPIQPEETTFFLGRTREGEVAALEHNPKQLELFKPEPVDASKVVPIIGTQAKSSESGAKE